MKAFKAARLFVPQKVNDMKPDANTINSLAAFPFFTSSTLSNLKSELPVYLVKAADISADTCVVDWWERNCHSLPHWSSAVKKVLLVQPTTAAAERVFSLLNSSFGNRQDGALQDYMEPSLMLQYNAV